MYALLIGTLAGLITLIRPSNILVLLLLVFWGITSIRDLGSRLGFYLRNIHFVLLMILGFIMVWVPQFIYWHYVSGSLFLYTYGSDGQGFFFSNPQIYHLLFSYRKGWFVYTPIMFIALFGFYFLYRKNRGVFWPVIIYLLANVYILASWWSWWNGGSFGLRSFIDMYGLMAFPLAALITWIMKQKYFIMLPAMLIIAATVYLNIFQTIQMRKGIMHDFMMTKKSYWYIFHNMQSPPRASYWDNLVYPDYQAAKKGIYYPITEINLKVEKKLNMRGWEYMDQLRDSIANQPELIKEIIRRNKAGASLDSLINVEATTIFKEVVDRYNKEIP